MTNTNKVLNIFGEIIFYLVLIAIPLWMFDYIRLDTVISANFNETKTWYEISFNVIKVLLVGCGYLFFMYLVKFGFEKLWRKITYQLDYARQWASDSISLNAEKTDKKSNDLDNQVILDRRVGIRLKSPVGDDRRKKQGITGRSETENSDKVPNPENEQ